MSGLVWIASGAAVMCLWFLLPPAAITRLTPVIARTLPPWAESRVDGLPSKTRWMVGAGAGVGVAIVLWDLFPVVIPLAVGVVPAVWIALGKLEPSSARHRREVTLNVLPEALDLMGACLRAGQPLRTASITVGQAMGPPMGVLFNSVNHAISVGMSDEQAWKVLGDDPVLGEVARDIARCASWGTTTVEVLAHHSRALRRAAAQCRINRAKQVGVKSVLPLGLCYLPAFLLLGVVPVIAAGVAGFLS